MSSGPEPSPPAPAAAAEGPALSAQFELRRTYLGAAGSYLKTANEQSSKVAYTMRGLSDGSETLGTLKDAISSARFVENVGFFGDYLERIPEGVPLPYSKLGDKIGETHRLFRAAMDEYLQFWKDGNEAHIESGTATFKRCATLMNESISDATTATNQLATTQ